MLWSAPIVQRRSDGCLEAVGSDLRRPARGLPGSHGERDRSAGTGEPRVGVGVATVHGRFASERSTPWIASVRLPSRRLGEGARLLHHAFSKTVMRVR